MTISISPPRDVEASGLIDADTLWQAGFATSFSRRGRSLVATATLASGRLLLVGVSVPPSRIAGAVSFCSVGAAATPANQVAGIFGQSGGTWHPLALSLDDTNNPWPANTIKTFPLAATWTSPAAWSTVMLGLWVTAATVPTLLGVTHATSAANARAPVTMGTSTAGLTTPASCPDPVAAPGAISGDVWCFLT